MAINNSYDTIAGFNPIAVYSLRKRISTYAGPSIRVRDDFDDSEQDVGFDVSGWVAPFVTVGTPFVTTFYDQKGVENLVNPTFTSQPIFRPVGSYIGRPIIEFFDGTKFLKTTDFTNPSANQFDVARPGGFTSYETRDLEPGSTLYQMVVGIPDDLVLATRYEHGFGRSGFRNLAFSSDTARVWGPTITPYTTVSVLSDMQTSITDVQLYDDSGTLTTFPATDVTYGATTTALYMGRMGTNGSGRSYSNVSEYVFYDQAITVSQRTDIFDTLIDSFKTTGTDDYQHFDAVKTTVVTGGDGAIPVVKATAIAGGSGASFISVKATAITYFPDIKPEVSANVSFDPVDERILLSIPNFNGDNIDGWNVSGGFTTQLELVAGYGEADTGSKFFRGGSAAISTASTTINFDAYATSGVLSGLATFEISWAQRSLAGLDQGAVSYEFCNKAGVSLSNPFNSVASDRWRVFVTRSGSNGDTTIAEIEMRETVGGLDVCVGGVASSSSSFSASYMANNAFDDNLTTLWATSAGDTAAGGSWIEYQFLTPVTIIELVLTARSGSFSDQAPKDFTLEYWDGASWISVMDRIGEDAWSSLEQRVFSGVGATTSTYVAASSAVWDKTRLTNIPIPALAAKVKITLIAKRISGTDNDSFFDSIRTNIAIPVNPKPSLTILGNINYRSLVSVTPVNAWSMIKRNDLYNGPALRIEDGGNLGTFVDVAFDASGKVSGVLPYADNRCIILYDQFGSDDFIALSSDNIQVVNIGTKTTWGLRPTGIGMWVNNKTSTSGNEPAWQMPFLAWNLAIDRTSNTASLQNIFGVTNGSYLEYGLWLEANDLHWRVNSSSAQDWSSTDWIIDGIAVQNKISRCIGDMTSGSTAVAYTNNNQVGSRAGVLPIAYPDNRLLGLFDHEGIGSAWQLGDFYELAIHSPNLPMSLADRTYIDAGMQEFTVPTGPVSYRYWRINVTQINGDVSGRFSVSELELRSTIGGADITTPADAVLRATSKSNFGSNTPDLAFDDLHSSGTWFTSGGSVYSGSGEWVMWDFGSGNEQIILEVGMRAIHTQLGFTPDTFTLEFSPDSISWGVAISVTGQTGWVANELRVFS